MLPHGRGVEGNGLGGGARSAAAGGDGERYRRAIAALSQTPLAGRFVCWRGLTGKSYVFSVYAAADCPAFCDAVVVAVARDKHGDPCRLAAFDTGAFPEPIMARVRDELGAYAGGLELHVHLLARTASHRRDALTDLEAAFDLILEPEAPRPPASVSAWQCAAAAEPSRLAGS